MNFPFKMVPFQGTFVHFFWGATLSEINKAPKNGWLEYYFPIGKGYIQVRTVRFRVCKFSWFLFGFYLSAPCPGAYQSASRLISLAFFRQTQENDHHPFIKRETFMISIDIYIYTWINTHTHHIYIFTWIYNHTFTIWLLTHSCRNQVRTCNMLALWNSNDLFFI